MSRVVLSGGGSLAPQLGELLEGALELPVTHGDPLRTVDGSHRRDAPPDAQKEGPFLAVPVGLALAMLK